jgi:hypothetical protein
MMYRILTFAAALVGTLVLATSASAQADLDCDDFGSQAEAQAELDSDPSDPHRLDADDDGQACEAFDYPAASGSGDESTSADVAVPERADLGGGGAAGSINPLRASAAAAGMLLSFGGAVYVIRRGR